MAFPDGVDKFFGKLEVCVGPYMYSGVGSHEDESSDAFKVDFMNVCEFKTDTLSEVFAMSEDAVPAEAKCSWIAMLHVLYSQLDLFLLDCVFFCLMPFCHPLLFQTHLHVIFKHPKDHVKTIMAHPLWSSAVTLYYNFRAAAGKSVFEKIFKGAGEAKKAVIETQFCHFDSFSALVEDVKDSVIS